MAKNVTKAPQPMLAMERDVQNMEAKVASGNLKAGAAYEAPIMNNQKRKQQVHIGDKPAPDMQGLT